jgi:uncharacterized membrane protein YedE/YeeE
LALFGIIGFLALMVSVFLLPLKFFFQTIKNNPEKSWAGLVGIWIILSSMIFGLTSVLKISAIQTRCQMLSPVLATNFFLFLFSRLINAHFFYQ